MGGGPDRGATNNAALWNEPRYNKPLAVHAIHRDPLFAGVAFFFWGVFIVAPRPDSGEEVSYGVERIFCIRTRARGEDGVYGSESGGRVCLNSIQVSTEEGSTASGNLHSGYTTDRYVGNIRGIV